MALRTVGVRLQAEVSGYVNSLRTAKAATKDFGAELDKAAKAGKLDEVANALGGVGLAAVAGFGAAIAVTAKFDKQMSEVGAVSGATAGDLDRLRQAALDAGQATSFSATEAAKAQAELAKAGLSTSQILSGGLSGALSLAAAGSLDLAEAAEIAAKTMNVFKLEGKDVGHIADVLSAAANKSATDVHEMGEALKQGGLAASSAGMSMEETVGTLSAFADRALAGSDAGTSLKTAIMMLQAPTDKSKALMEELGISAYDVSGNFVGTAKLAGQLQSQLGHLTQEQRNAALAQIFGADAMRAANVLYEVGEQGIRDYVAAVDDQGAAAEVAAAKTDNLMGDIERLKGALETLAIEASGASTGGLRTLVQGTDRLVESVSGIPGPVQEGIVVFAAVGGAMALAAAGAIKVRRGTADMLDELRQTGPTGQRAADGIGKFGKAAGIAAVGLAALNAAGATLGTSVNPQIELLSIQTAEFARTGQRGSEVARVFGDDMGMLDTALKDIADTGMWSSSVRGITGLTEGLTGLGNLYDNSLQHSRERLVALDQALTQLVQGGKTAEAAAAFKQIADRAAEQGISVAELNRVLPGYAAAVQTAGTESGTAAGAVGEVGTAAEQTKEDVDALKAAFDELFGATMSVDRATLEYKGGLDTLTETVKGNKRTLDESTVSGRENKGAVLDQIDAINDLRTANIDNGMSVTEADATYQAQLGTLQATLIKLGLNEKQVKELIDRYREIPRDVGTTLKANTAGAKSAVSDFLARYAQVKNKSVSIHGYVRWTSSGLKVPGGTILANARGGVYEHAADGLLREAQIATPRSPARYAWAEPSTGGEAFIPRRGDWGRSMAILKRAAGWYGQTLQPQRQQPQYTTAPTGVMGGGGGMPKTVVLQLANHGVIGSRMEMENWLTGAVDSLRRKGRI